MDTGCGVDENCLIYGNDGQVSEDTFSCGRYSAGNSLHGDATVLAVLTLSV